MFLAFLEKMAAAFLVAGGVYTVLSIFGNRDYDEDLTGNTYENFDSLSRAVFRVPESEFNRRGRVEEKDEQEFDYNQFAFDYLGVDPGPSYDMSSYSSMLNRDSEHQPVPSTPTAPSGGQKTSTSSRDPTDVGSSGRKEPASRSTKDDNDSEEENKKKEKKDKKHKDKDGQSEKEESKGKDRKKHKDKDGQSDKEGSTTDGKKHKDKDGKKHKEKKDKHRSKDE